MPGPTLRFTEGDHIFINVVNNAQHNVTIHWYCLEMTVD
jgi:FtsP/CotA-like multicopper oxidase with cupredoxin domain